MSLCRFGASARLVSKFVVALVFAAASLSMWGCDGGEGVAGFNNVALLSISNSSLPAGKVGDAYSATINGSGGAESGYVWSVIVGDLPTGLVLLPVGTPNATLSGTPIISGTFLITIRVQDARGESASAQFSLTIAPATLTILTPNPLPDGNADKNYSVEIEADLGTGQGYTWSIQAGGQLPPGLTINPTSAPGSHLTTISGIPTDTGTLPLTFTFIVQVIDSGGFSASQQYQLHVNAPLRITTDYRLPDGCMNNPYGNQPQPPVQVPPLPPVLPNSVITASGGTESGYTWSTTPSVPIPGVTIDASGMPAPDDDSTTFTGAPTTSGNFKFSVTVSDNNAPVPNVTTKGALPGTQFEVVVHPAIAVTPSAVPEGTVGVPLPVNPQPLTFSATGGPPGSTFTYAFAQAVPPVAGVTLAANGQLTGTPTIAGTYIFDVVASTSFQQLPAISYPLQVFKGVVQVTFVVVGTLNITTAKMLPMNQNTTFFQLISATGGSGGYTWQISAGALPTPLLIVGSGTPSTNIQGTPINRGPYNFTIRVTDNGGRFDEETYDGVVDYPAGTIQTVLDPKGDGLVAAGTIINQHLNGAALWSPEGIAVDSAGNVYIADTNDHRIRRVDAISGIISTICGTGVASTTGDGGQAVSATCNTPTGLAVDNDPAHPGAPCLYFSERAQGKIRRITFSTGVITHVGGVGSNSSYNGELDTANATTRYLNSPRGLAVDNAGNVYIADTNNHRIRKLIWDPAANGGLGWFYMKTVAGSLVSGYQGSGAFQDDVVGGATPASSTGILWGPQGVSVAPDGSYLLIADTNNNYIRRVNLLTNTISRVAGNGAIGGSGTSGYNPAHENQPALSATLFAPRDVAIDYVTGDFYIADTYAYRIRKVKASDGRIVNMVGAVSGSGPGGAAVRGIAGDDLSASQNALATISDPTAMVFYKNASNATFLYFTQCPDASSPTMYNNFAYHAARRLRLAAAPNDLLERVAGWGRGRLLYPFHNNSTFMGGNGSNHTLTGSQPQTLPGVWTNSYGLSGHNRIQMKVIQDKAGNIFIADCGNHRVLRYNPTTNALLNVAGNGIFGNPASMPAVPLSSCLNAPCDVALWFNNPEEEAGDQSATAIYIADYINRSVRRVDLAPGGQMTTVAGNVNIIQPYANPGDGAPATLAEIGGPQSITFDQYNRLYIGCYGAVSGINHYRVRQVDMFSGTINTFVNSTGNTGNAGDNSSAASATIYYIMGMCTDANYLYICDWQAQRVRKVGLINNIIEHFAGHPNTTGGGFTDNVPASQTSAIFNCPQGISVDSFGNAFIADSANHRLRKVTASTQIVSTIAGTGSQGYSLAQDGGQATSAQVSYPTAAFITPDGGSLWVMDTNNQRIRRVVKP
ncbi:MAG: hypothetical protein IT462_15465 [Planctomycetes bacterium]|nr:hypothetical protein [Planctomycetota bacterium]